MCTRKRSVKCTPIRAQLEALAELVARARCAIVGLSNENPWGVMQFTPGLAAGIRPAARGFDPERL